MQILRTLILNGVVEIIERVPGALELATVFPIACGFYRGRCLFDKECKSTSHLLESRSLIPIPPRFESSLFPFSLCASLESYAVVLLACVMMEPHFSQQLRLTPHLQIIAHRVGIWVHMLFALHILTEEHCHYVCGGPFFM